MPNCDNSYVLMSSNSILKVIIFQPELNDNILSIYDLVSVIDI